MKRKLSKSEFNYLRLQRIHNKSNLTWRQFYTLLYGDCFWMESTQYGGSWLDKIMGEQ